MSTYRERRLARAERLRDWAGKREAASDAAFARAHDATAGIPFGQPILVGHHSEKRHRAALRRGDTAMSSAVENSRMAGSMASRADEIERQAAGAIYSDDPDAKDRLAAKIKALEGERDRMKAANAAFRRENRDALKAMSAYERGQAVPFPSYSLTNLSGNLGRLRKRLATIDRAPVERLITARYDGRCEDCGADLSRGQLIRYSRAAGAKCAVCPEREEG